MVIVVAIECAAP
jgi:hypothetical protein